MCKVLVTCYITLMLATVANGKPLYPLSYIDYAIKDVTELEKRNFIVEALDFYTPEDFTNEERRMEALAVYMAEMKVLKEEINDTQNDQINIYFDNILKNLHPFVTTTELKCNGCQQKNVQEFLEGLLKLLQSIRKSISPTVESN